MLTANRPSLNEYGIDYPEIGIKGFEAHFGIYHELLDNQTSPTFLKALAVHQEAPIKVFSCETFWLLSADQLAGFAQHLEPSETEAILYLRSPWSYLPSSYRQMIKHDGLACGIGEYCESIVQRLDYPALIKRWSRVVPIKVRLYETSKHNLTADFCRTANIPSEAIRTIPGLINKTPSEGAHRMMRWVNRGLPPQVGRRVRKLLVRCEQGLKFMPRMDDRAACSTIQTAIAQWDTGVLARYLSAEQIDILRSPSASRS